MIGWFGPTNTLDRLAGQMVEAWHLAVEDAEAESSSDALVEWRSAWTSQPWASGVSSLFKLVYEHPVKVLVGSVDGPATHLAEQVVAKARLALISPVSTDGSVTLAGVPWMFACAPTDRAIADPLVEALAGWQRTSERPWMLLVSTGHDARMFARAFMRVLGGRGEPPARRIDVPPDCSELGPVLEALHDVRPGALVIVGGPIFSARLVKACKRVLPGGKVFGSHHMGREPFIREAGEAGEGVCFPLLFDPAHEDRRVRDFVGKFAARRGCNPDYTAAFTYDAVRLAMAAARQGGDRLTVCRKVAELVPWKGISGTIVWDPTGQNPARVTRLGVIDGGRVRRWQQGRSQTRALVDGDRTSPRSL